jgi:hypothetical protein
MNAKTWSELKSEGVRRCCAMFQDGTQCRRRAIEQFEHSWCAKHGPVMRKHINEATRILNAEND